MDLLVVDDEETLRSVVSQVLSADGFTVEEAASGEEALEAFRSVSHPLVITDIRMGGMSGIELLTEIKEHNPDTQVVIMTSHASLDSALTALRAGAYDYLVKPFESLDLISAVAGRAAEKARLVTQNRELLEQLTRANAELKEANLALKELAVRDGLTALYNHRYFQEVLALEVARSKRYQKQCSLIFMDVDNFKMYNDTNGHPQGDALLKTLAQIMTTHLRVCDVAARYGGEEFVLLLPETPKEAALGVAEELRCRVEGHPFPGGVTQPLGKVTISLGVAAYPGDGSNAPELLDFADQLLYKAKNSGKNMVVAEKG
ncbi:sensor histidine kinase/GGDEF domain protein [Citrifermentans bremense]|uniref:diguanylate cyclase n=1 Tax=Citrifermentans bremense TaxID=60035 RepID=A0A6S6M5X5_9BACT|nr:diguanylate cyclase [Citrifermentans bremense]BCG46765.1 sensor histidine kinase/GGDEF domain protein [Citrifermentans bremense]